MAGIELRDGGRDDLGALVRFNAAMARETEGRELDADRLEAGVAAILAEADGAGRGAYRIAERDGRAVGCLMVTREWSDWRNGWFWWIQSVYVEPEARRSGVLRALYEDVLGRARAADDVCGVRLYVEHENEVARGAYRRLGMADSSYRMMEVDLVSGPGPAEEPPSEPNGPPSRP
jgi:ribosomal protein S18 acetylase RimI-like enzyme